MLQVLLVFNRLSSHGHVLSNMSLSSGVVGDTTAFIQQALGCAEMAHSQMPLQAAYHCCHWQARVAQHCDDGKLMACCGGCSAGGLLQGLMFPTHGGLGRLGNSIAWWLGIRPYELFLYVFLPPLLLDAAVRIDWFLFKKARAQRLLHFSPCVI
jgi:hypothetical protein